MSVYAVLYWDMLVAYSVLRILNDSLPYDQPEYPVTGWLISFGRSLYSSDQSSGYPQDYQNSASITGFERRNAACDDFMGVIGYVFRSMSEVVWRGHQAAV